MWKVGNVENLGKVINACIILVGNTESKRLFRDLDADKRIIVLNWLLNK
jgi:hypothetical protein